VNGAAAPANGSITELLLNVGALTYLTHHDAISGDSVAAAAERRKSLATAEGRVTSVPQV